MYACSHFYIISHSMATTIKIVSANNERGASKSDLFALKRICTHKSVKFPLLNAVGWKLECTNELRLVAHKLALMPTSALIYIKLKQIKTAPETSV